jgi:hypothetical protein
MTALGWSLTAPLRFGSRAREHVVHPPSCDLAASAPSIWQEESFAFDLVDDVHATADEIQVFDPIRAESEGGRRRCCASNCDLDVSMTLLPHQCPPTAVVVDPMRLEAINSSFSPPGGRGGQLLEVRSAGVSEQVFMAQRHSCLGD